MKIQSILGNSLQVRAWTLQSKQLSNKAHEIDLKQN